MKRYILYFIMPLLFSCSSDVVQGDDVENDDFEYVAGGYIFGEEIYVYKNGELIPAHNYIYETGEDSHTSTLRFISFGICKVEDLSSNGQVKITLPAYPPIDNTYYDYSKLNRYLQDVEFILPENLSDSTRDYKFRIISDGFNGFAADIIIRQAGR